MVPTPSSPPPGKTRPLQIPGVSCPCGSRAVVVTVRPLPRGGAHYRADCARCRNFLKFVGQTSEVKDLVAANLLTGEEAAPRDLFS
jgi:hypothetical protein